VLTAYGLHTEQGKGKSNLVLRVGGRRSDATIFKFVPASLFISPFSHSVFGTYQSIPNLQSRKKLGSGIDVRGCLRRSAVAVSRYFVFLFFLWQYLLVPSVNFLTLMQEAQPAAPTLARDAVGGVASTRGCSQQHRLQSRVEQPPAKGAAKCGHRRQQGGAEFIEIRL
jgi:hypothetical protein